MEIIAVTDYKKLYMRLKQFSKNKYIVIWLVVLKTIYINRRIRPFTLLYILFPSSLLVGFGLVLFSSKVCGNRSKAFSPPLSILAIFSQPLGMGSH